MWGYQNLNFCRSPNYVLQYFDPYISKIYISIPEVKFLSLFTLTSSVL